MKTEDKQPTQGRRKLRFPSSRREEIIDKQYTEIKQLESRYRKLYEGSPVMLRTINTEGIILDCNQAYVSGLGFSGKSDVIGHSIFEHTPDDAILAKRESFEEWRRSGLVKNKEVWLKRTDGSKFLALINANNLYDDEGHLVGSNTVITDLTEILKTKRQQEKVTEEIRKTQGMKEEFIRIAAHELRTPIQPILLIAELAKGDSIRQDEAWEIVVKETRKLKRLADDILDVSRIESGDLSYNMQKVRLSDIIPVVANHARKQIEGYHKSQKLTVIAEVDTANDDVDLLLDSTRMIQALDNVVDNSIKFTDEGQITIWTQALPGKKLLEIKITDTGSAISEDLLPKLFDKFGTKTSGAHADKHGVGLGLFISKSIIQAHGGDIFGHNNEGGKGAIFVIRLPIA